MEDIRCCLSPSSGLLIASKTVGPGDRRAFCRQSITAGTVVLRNAPLAYAVHHDREHRCAHCLRTAPGRSQSTTTTTTTTATATNKLSRCGRCKQTWYCSRTCQKRDFPHHRDECHAVASNNVLLVQGGGGGSVMISLLIRTYLALRARPEDDCNCEEESPVGGPQLPRTVVVVVGCGSTHFENLSPFDGELHPDEVQDVDHATQILWDQATASVAKLGTATTSSSSSSSSSTTTIRSKNPPDKEWLRAQLEGYMRRFRTNNFGVTDAMMHLLAAAVYPLGALLNHSCAPNCVVRYVLRDENDAATATTNKWCGPILEIVAAQDIAVGDELTHSYVELVASTATRQARLQEIHGFTCHCSRCAGRLQVPLLNGCANKVDSNEVVEWILRHYNPYYSSSRSNSSKNSDGIQHQEAPTHYLDMDEALHAPAASHASSSLTKAAREAWHQGKKAMANDYLEGELRYLGDAVKLLAQQACGGTNGVPFSLELYEARGDRLGSLIVAGQTREALLECKHIVAFLCLALYHVPNHPLLGLQLFTLGDLYEANDDFDKAQLTYRWAEKSLTVSQGPTSEMVRLLQSKMVHR